LNVGKQHFEQKAEKISFLSKALSRTDQNDGQNIDQVNRVNKANQQSLRSPISLYGFDISIGNIRQF